VDGLRIKLGKFRPPDAPAIDCIVTVCVTPRGKSARSGQGNRGRPIVAWRTRARLQGLRKNTSKVSTGARILRQLY